MIVLFLTFAVSVILLPWWVVVPLGIVSTSYRYGNIITIIGGIIIDASFGAPVHTLGGFQYIYTTIFVLAALVAYFLRSRIVE